MTSFKIKILTFFIVVVSVTGRPQNSDEPRACNLSDGFGCVQSDECRISTCKREDESTIAEADLRSGLSDIIDCSKEKYVTELEDTCKESSTICCHESNIKSSQKGEESCEELNDFKCVSENECSISNCRFPTDLDLPEVRNVNEEETDCSSAFVSKLNSTCIDVRQIASDDSVEVCCHSSFIKTSSANEKIASNEVTCENTDGHRCVPTNECRISQCKREDESTIDEADLRSGLSDIIDCSKEKYVTGLEHKCSAESTICCHESNIKPEPSQKSVESESCEDLNDFKCVPDNECSISNCRFAADPDLPEVRNVDEDDSDCSSTFVSKLNSSCIDVRNIDNDDSTQVCCHSSFVKPSAARETNIPSIELGCENIDDYSCTVSSECTISHCKYINLESLDLRTGVDEDELKDCQESSEHVLFLNSTCLGIRTSDEFKDDLICCHNSLKTVKTEKPDKATPEHTDPEVEFDCDEEQRYSCVDPSDCEIAHCRYGYKPDDLDIRKQDFDDFDCSLVKNVHVKYLNASCINVRSSRNDESVCCHQTFQKSIKKTAINVKPDDDDETELVCEDNTNFRCIEASQCPVAHCKKNNNLDLAEVRSGGADQECTQLLPETAKYLNNATCIDVRSSGKKDLVCCHQSYINKEAEEEIEDEDDEESENACLDDANYSCVEPQECTISHCLLIETPDTLDIRQGSTPEVDCLGVISKYVKNLNSTCLGVRTNEDKRELVCCHNSHLKYKKTEVTSACDEFDTEGYRCVSKNACSLYSCLLAKEDIPETDIRNNEDYADYDESFFCPPQHVAYLNSTCNLDSNLICCHDNYVSEQISTEKPKPKFEPKCGRHNLDLDIRTDIQLDRTTAEFGEWPYICGIFKTTSIEGKSKFLAGATLIAPGIVLTVAHWVDDMQLTPDNLLVRCRDWNINSVEELEEHQERVVVDISIHPGFDLASARNDFALLHLNEDFELGENLDTICLPKTANTTNEFLNDCYAAGWGKDSHGDASKISDLLRQVKLPLKSKSECELSLQSVFGETFRLHDSFMCAGGIRGEDTCKGDGGGPLFCKMPGTEEERYVQAGLVSWGYQCGLPNIPGVYASTAFALCFIDYVSKCKHKEKYIDFINIKGCDNWLQNEKSKFEKSIQDMEKVMAKTPHSELRYRNAEKERDKMLVALEKVEKLEIACNEGSENNGNSDSSVFSPRQDAILNSNSTAGKQQQEEEDYTDYFNTQ